MSFEDKWLGLSPGGWEKDDGSQGSIWGWLCRFDLTQSLGHPLAHSLCPGKAVDTGHTGLGWSPASLTEPCALQCWQYAHPELMPLRAVAQPAHLPSV